MRNLTYKEKHLIHQKEVKHKRNLIILVAFTGGAAFLIYFLMFSGIVAIRNFDFKGLSDDTESDIKEATNGYLKAKKWGIFRNASNIFFFDMEDLSQRLRERFLELESVQIYKNYLQRSILIDLKKREKIGVYCNDSKETCFYFDSRRLLFEEAPFISGGSLITLVAGDKIDLQKGDYIIDLNDSDLEIILKAYNLVYQSKFLSINYISIFKDAPKEYRLETSAGYPIHMTTLVDPEQGLAGLKQLFKDQPELVNRQMEYIDLRVASRIYYK